ncbi:uncharacterized protein [Hetaerina americana]|uniref:uncharacterized protein n=1 Tax=Hetaerina americana TaxID=62018 RepID=UPI003A7F265B
MPACANEAIGRMWCGHQRARAVSNLSSTSSSSGSSPSEPTSPVLIRANGTTRRFSLPLNSSPLPPNGDKKDTCIVPATAPSSPTLTHHQRNGSATWPESPPPPPMPSGFIGWYPVFLLRLVWAIMTEALSRLVWYRLVLFWPSLFVSLALELLWKAVGAVTGVLEAIHTPVWERARRKRTVLISGGSTLQTLQMARNFHDAGARVVVCEQEGLFPLARFSAAVSAYHTVPRPEGRTHEYVCALCRIAEKENATLYIPVSATNAAYYDALAKPHLEQLGVKVFCPSARDVCRLEDVWELMRRCNTQSLVTPVCHKVVSREQVLALYSGGPLKRRLVAFTAGPMGARARHCVLLPKTRAEFQEKIKLDDLNELQPWVIVQDIQGEHLITCTTVRDSCITANVTCCVVSESDGKDGVLQPVHKPEVVPWLERFLSGIETGMLKGTGGKANLSTHLTFHLVVPPGGGAVIPLACRVGVSLPYVCLSSEHPKAVWKPCRHAETRCSFGHAGAPLLASAPRLWLPSITLRTLLRPTMQCLVALAYTLCKGREAVFVVWDPLPFFAHHGVQIPLEALGKWCGVLRVTPFGHTLFDPFLGGAVVC